jgi:plastocyanin
MRRTQGITSALLFASSIAACGGGEEPAEEEVPAAEAPAPTAPAPTGAADWITIDEAANTVTLDIVAGRDGTNNNWNFNGYANGGYTVTVPQGATVTINFTNNDANMGHSIGVSEKPAGPWPATPAPTPAFAGGISSNPTSMTDSTMNGETETITFTADRAGEFALICFVPGHATAGMWINLSVGGTGSAQ